MNATIRFGRASMFLLAAAFIGPAAIGPAVLPAAAGDAIATVDYACKDGKTIRATFHDSSVDLVLGDGRKLSLPQARSADGGRYATADESFVFWSVGDKAFVTEGDPNAQTYADCAGKRE